MRTLFVKKPTRYLPRKSGRSPNSASVEKGRDAREHDSSVRHHHRYVDHGKYDNNDHHDDDSEEEEEESNNDVQHQPKSTLLKVVYFLGMTLVIFCAMGDRVWYMMGAYNKGDPADVEDKNGYLRPIQPDNGSFAMAEEGVPPTSYLRNGLGQITEEEEQQQNFAVAAEAAVHNDNNSFLPLPPAVHNEQEEFGFIHTQPKSLEQENYQQPPHIQAAYQNSEEIDSTSTLPMDVKETKFVPAGGSNFVGSSYIQQHQQQQPPQLSSPQYISGSTQYAGITSPTTDSMGTTSSVYENVQPSVYGNVPPAAPTVYENVQPTTQSVNEAANNNSMMVPTEMQQQQQQQQEQQQELLPLPPLPPLPPQDQQPKEQQQPQEQQHQEEQQQELQPEEQTSSPPPPKIKYTSPFNTKPNGPSHPTSQTQPGVLPQNAAPSYDANSQTNLNVNPPEPRDGSTLHVVFQLSNGGSGDGTNNFRAFPIVRPSITKIEPDNSVSQYNDLDFEEFGVTRTIRPNDHELFLEEKELQWKEWEEEIAKHPYMTPQTTKLTWNSKAISTCNNFHELFEGYSDVNATYLGEGSYRDAWGMVDPQDALKTGSRIQSIVLKRPKAPLVNVDNNEIYSFDNILRGHQDATFMEQFASSPDVVNIYGHCGMSVFVEPMDNTLINKIAPNFFFQQRNPDQESRQSGNQLSGEEKLDIALDLARAVTALTRDNPNIITHSSLDASAIVHGDIHAKNFLIAPESGALKMSDFETANFIVKGVETNDSNQKHGGGLACVAPEGRVNGFSDVYSLGCVYYTVLTGLLGGNDIHWSTEEPKHLLIPDEYVTDSAHPIDHHLSDLIGFMTQTKPEARPNIWNVIDRLKQMKPQPES